MSTFTFVPEYGSPVSVTPRVRKAKFGDGYAQRVGDGINALERSWSLVFKGTAAEIDAIDAFLTARDGTESFDWTPPSGMAGKWICEQWGRTPVQYNEETLNATFEEVFGD